MSYDYEIYNFYQEIYETLLSYKGCDSEETSEESINKEIVKVLLIHPFYLKKEFYMLIKESINEPFKLNLRQIARLFHERLNNFINDNYYKLYYNYAVYKLNKIENKNIKYLKVNMGQALWTNYTISHLATEMHKFELWKEILPIEPTLNIERIR